MVNSHSGPNLMIIRTVSIDKFLFIVIAITFKCIYNLLKPFVIPTHCCLGLEKPFVGSQPV